MWPACRSRRRGDHVGGPAAELIAARISSSVGDECRDESLHLSELGMEQAPKNFLIDEALLS
jgi:hypothetical protein